MRVDPSMPRTADRPGGAGGGGGRLGRALLVWALALGTFWVAEPYLRGWLYAAREPRAVAARGALADAERNAVEVFEARAPSVALIVTAAAVRDAFGRAGTAAGTGSGFVWDEAGHVVTNNHVVAEAQEIRVRLEADRAIRAEVVGTAPDYDLAVLRPLAPLPPAAQPVPLGSSADLVVGQTVYAIGNPFGLGRSMSSGIISALDRHLPAASGREIRGVVQTDAAINPGNSGGPLLDSAGRLIGVNTAIVSGSGSSAGVGFAVPVDVVNEVVPELIRRGRAPRPGGSGWPPSTSGPRPPSTRPGSSSPRSSRARPRTGPACEASTRGPAAWATSSPTSTAGACARWPSSRRRSAPPGSATKPCSRYCARDARRR
jgi:2-alkenal reductase